MSASTSGYTGSWITSPANALTASRLILSPLLFWVILEAEPDKGTSWAAFGLGVLLGLTDYLDGPVARMSGSFTRFGAFVDPLADKVVVVGAAVCFAMVGHLWWIPVIIVAAREAIISVVRIYWAGRGLAMPARLSAKWKSFIQGLALLVAALPIFENAEVFVNLCWIGATILTVYTGVQYVMDGSKATTTGGAKT